MHLQSPRINEETLPKLRVPKAAKQRKDGSLQSNKSTIQRSLATDDETVRKGKPVKASQKDVSLNPNMSISVESSHRQLIEEN